MRKNQILIFLLSLFIPVLIFSNTSIERCQPYSFALHSKRGENLSFAQKQCLTNLQFINQLFLISYAPMNWKVENIGLNFDQEMAKTVTRVKNRLLPESTDFQMLIKNLLFSFKDYHVLPTFYSTGYAMLPFQIQSAHGRYFIVEILSDDEEFLLSVGDEIISFEGIDIHKVMEIFKRQAVGSNYLPTDQALAELFFTQRMGFLGHPLPRNSSVNIVVRSKETGDLLTYTVEWYQEEEVVSPLPLSYNFAKGVTSASKAQKSKAKQTRSFLKKSFMTPYYKALSFSHRFDAEPSMTLGAKKSMIPILGPVLWSASEEGDFHAYLFELPSGKKGGYVRIPSYETGEDGEKLAKQFGEIIKVFEEQSDVLLIDQLNNPGGSAPYVYGLLSMLTDQPLEVPLHRLKLTQEDVCEAGTLIADLESTDDLKDWTDIFGETFDGLPLSETFRKGFIDACYFIIDQWNQGKLFTDFHPLYGLETVEPNPEVHYTKPIVVLINSLDFSGGDFFPAIMQDNKRAILLGTRTAGAGGCVDIVSFRNLSGIEEVSVTASFALRPNREPIENLGVTPDIVYNLSVIDLQEGYREYKKRILEELEKHGNTDF